MFGLNNTLSKLFSTKAVIAKQCLEDLSHHEECSSAQKRIFSYDVDVEFEDLSQKSGNLNLSLMDAFRNITLSAMTARLDMLFLGRNIIYKFGKPCKHNAYRTGDSIEETFHMSLSSFNHLFAQIGVIYNSTDAYLEACQNDDPFEGKLYLRYYDRMAHVTYYLRNDPVADILFPNTRKIPIKSGASFPSPQQNCVSRNTESSSGETSALPSKKPCSSTKFKKSISRNCKDEFRNNKTDIRTNPILGSRAGASEYAGMKARAKDQDHELEQVKDSPPTPSTSLVTTTNDRSDEKTERLARRKTTEAHSTSRHANEVRSQEKKTSSQRELSPHLKGMLSIWKNWVGTPLHEKPDQTVSSFMAERMSTVLTDHFKGSLESWRDCCIKIARSRWLMGEDPRTKWSGAYLVWILKHIDEVDDNKYDQNRQLPLTPEELQIEIAQKALGQEQQTLSRREEHLRQEVLRNRETELKKAISEVTTGDKSTLFVEFAERQKQAGEPLSVDSALSEPWNHLGMLDRLLWESTLADFVKPTLFAGSLEDAVSRRLTEERVEIRLSEIEQEFENLQRQQQAILDLKNAIPVVDETGDSQAQRGKQKAEQTESKASNAHDHETNEKADFNTEPPEDQDLEDENPIENDEFLDAEAEAILAVDYGYETFLMEEFGNNDTSTFDKIPTTNPQQIRNKWSVQ